MSSASLCTSEVPVHTSVVSAVPRGRDLRLDFFRGLALLMIFVDHVSGNRFAAFTLQSMGFADAAEVFVFIAGISGVYAYRKTILKQGLIAGFKAVFPRIRLLYLTHLAMVAGVILLAAAAKLYGTEFDILDKLGLAPLLADPLQALLRLPILTYMPNYLDILPLYVVLLATLPLIILGQRIHVLLPVAAAVACYVSALISGATLPNLQDAEGWFLNPLAWILLFTLGATVTHLTITDFWSRIPRWVIATVTTMAAAYVVFAFLYAAPWRVFPALESYVALPITLETNKAFLSWHRIVDLLAKVWLVAIITPQSASFLSQGMGAAISGAGRHSLPVFVAGTFLAFGGSILLFETEGHALAHIGITFGGVFALLVLAWKLEGGTVRDLTEVYVRHLRRKQYEPVVTK
jgi:hypothetical protein